MLIAWARGGQLGRRGQGYQAILEFPDACGITVGTPVRIRGVQVGGVLAVQPSLQQVWREGERELWGCMSFGRKPKRAGCLLGGRAGGCGRARLPSQPAAGWDAAAGCRQHTNNTRMHASFFHCRWMCWWR